VVIALGVLALVGSAIGWLLLPRSSSVDTASDRAVQEPAVSLPSAEVDQHHQLLSRLRALQVDRGWFVELVDASQLSTEPQQDAPLRGAWTKLAEEWLARIALLPPVIRAQLGRLGAEDWQQPRQALLKQGVDPRVVEHLVSAGSQDLLPVTIRSRKPADPFLQLWIAAATQSLDDVEIVRLKARALEPTNTSLRIPAGGARLVLVEAPPGDAVALDINGTPLMQMMVFGVNGQVEEERGPLRAARIAPEAGSPLQVLVSNQGVSSSLFTLSCRADPLDQ
jgi:serine/threonine-protein kinase